MNKLEKKRMYCKAEYLRKMIEENEGSQHITIFYVKGEGRHVKRIFTEVLGEYKECVRFKERPLNEDEKRLRFLKMLLNGFIGYVLAFPILILSSIFLGAGERLLDLLFYFGNVIGFGCSYYVLRSGIKGRVFTFTLVGIICLLFNLAWLIEFLYTYMFV